MVVVVANGGLFRRGTREKFPSIWLHLIYSTMVTLRLLVVLLGNRISQRDWHAESFSPRDVHDQTNHHPTLSKPRGCQKSKLIQFCFFLIDQTAVFLFLLSWLVHIERLDQGFEHFWEQFGATTSTTADLDQGDKDIFSSFTNHITQLTRYDQKNQIKSSRMKKQNVHKEFNFFYLSIPSVLSLNKYMKWWWWILQSDLVLLSFFFCKRNKQFHKISNKHTRKVEKGFFVAFPWNIYKTNTVLAALAPSFDRE